LKIPLYTVLATDHVTFVGHPIAAVVATDKYAARDAIDLIMVDYEELPVVIDVEEAAKGGPLVYEEYGDNIAYKLTSGEGDIEAALAAADHVIKQRIVHQRLIPIAMEPRGVLARYYPGEKELTIWTSTQIPHLARTQLAIMLGVPENKVRVIAPEVGGGFGSKLNVYAEEGLVGWISMQLGKPVKWIEGRRENIQATIHGRGQIGYIEVGCKNDGTITGLRYNVFADMGAYLQLLTPAIPTLTGLMLSGCYKIPAIQMNVTAVFTNKMSTDAYRGAGRPEATQVIERAADLVAAELGMDPIDVRRKNFPEPTEFPFKTATGLFYDSGNYRGARKGAFNGRLHKDARGAEKAREQGRIGGIGVSTYVEICAIGPSQATPAGGWESATVRIEPTGKVTILTGASPHGQGQETSFAQLAADELGVDLNDVTVIHGDTSIVQYGLNVRQPRRQLAELRCLMLQKLKERRHSLQRICLEPTLRLWVSKKVASAWKLQWRQRVETATQARRVRPPRASRFRRSRSRLTLLTRSRPGLNPVCRLQTSLSPQTSPSRSVLTSFRSRSIARPAISISSATSRWTTAGRCSTRCWWMDRFTEELFNRSDRLFTKRPFTMTRGSS
jgi:carbon-monoxide dehydrogenase large subunit